MSTATAVSRSSIERRILSLQWVTLCWMVVECSVALTAAWRARSVSLLAFGSDSFVEVISAVVVLLQFSRSLRVSQTRAAKICGLLLYGLASVVSLIALAGLYLHVNADTSRLGIAITAAALLLMPILARMKRDAADQTGNKALRADAVRLKASTDSTLGPVAINNRYAVESFQLYKDEVTMGFFTPDDIKSFHSLYTLQLRYLLSVETQIVKGLESMITHASDEQLRQAFQSHMQETEVQITRLKGLIAEVNDGDADDKKDVIITALIGSADNIVSESKAGPLRDAGLLATAQKIEHYEIASYGAARNWAGLLQTHDARGTSAENAG